ncbi:transposase [Loigolactobacillus binensis]|uniref:Transposase n=1 Tax=Loigolactobacillus binensis TaxID=2559922 RepID=A0ABW3E9U6_9LACO|nr:transposase [Loigolactobacillus binensis]
MDLPNLIHSSLKKELPELELAIAGVITPELAEKMKLIKQHYEQLVVNKQALKTIILELARPYAKEIELIQSTPGFGSSMISSISVISEIGVDITKFYSAKYLCFRAGLTPTNNECAGKKHPEIRNHDLALKKRRGHRRAIITIARQLLTAIYHMLREHVPACD